jgi:hypothetical protein
MKLGVSLKKTSLYAPSTGVPAPPPGYQFVTRTIAGVTKYQTRTVTGVTYYEIRKAS